MGSEELKKVLAVIIVKMLTRNYLAFSITFVAVFVTGLLVSVIISLLGIVKEINIGSILIASILMGVAAVGIRIFLMRRFSRVGS